MTPAPEDELQKVRNRVTTDLARALESNAGLASALSRAQSLFGDWRYPLELPKVIESITAAEVQATARRAFTKENSVVVTMVRP